MTPRNHERSSVDERLGSIDERLRWGLEPGAAMVERVVRRALDEAPGRVPADRWGRWGRWLAAAAVVLAVASFWTVPHLRRERLPEGSEGRVSMANVGSVIVLDTGRDGRTVLLSGVSAAGEATWRGQIIIQRRERP